MHIGSSAGLGRSDLLSVQYRGITRPNAFTPKTSQEPPSTETKQPINPTRFKAEYNQDASYRAYQKPTVEVMEHSQKAKKALEGYLDNGEFSLYPGNAAENLAGIDLHA